MMALPWLILHQMRCTSYFNKSNLRSIYIKCPPSASPSLSWRARQCLTLRAEEALNLRVHTCVHGPAGGLHGEHIYHPSVRSIMQHLQAVNLQSPHHGPAAHRSCPAQTSLLSAMCWSSFLSAAMQVGFDPPAVSPRMAFLPFSLNQGVARLRRSLPIVSLTHASLVPDPSVSGLVLI